MGDELDQIDFMSDQPDTDTLMKGFGKRGAGDVEGASMLQRLAFLGTSPDVHAVNTLVYKVQIMPPDADSRPMDCPSFI